MAIKTRLPMGIESFKRIRTEGFYYIDKTGLIAGEDLITASAETLRAKRGHAD